MVIVAPIECVSYNVWGYLDSAIFRPQALTISNTLLVIAALATIGLSEILYRGTTRFNDMDNPSQPPLHKRDSCSSPGREIVF